MEWIDAIFEDVINRYQTSNPFELCKDLKIKVIFVNPKNPLLLGNESIYICSVRAIFLRDDLPDHLRRFYLCHELGHALLHPNIFYLKKKLINVWKQEKQANYFACLLEDAQIDDDRFYQVPISNISKILGVPEPVLRQLVNM